MRVELSRAAILRIAAAPIALLLFASLSAPLYAQSRVQEPTAVPGSVAEVNEDDLLKAAAEEGDRPVDEVTVTGSRLKRTEFSSSAPVEIITSERSQLAGLLDATDILQSTTVASGQQIDDSFSGFVTDGGAGANSISLRGLGAQRTLVLVNGKRWGPSGVRGSTNSVDLTAIPTSTIARYEILKDGASSVYGADAVAGVVNAITKERLDGSRLNGQVRALEDGGTSYSIDGAWGRVGDNWSFSVSGIYGKQERTIANDYKYSSCDIQPRSDGSHRDPATGEELCYGFIYGLTSGPFGFARYEPSLSDPNDTTNPYYDPDIQPYGIPFYTTVGINDLPNQGGFYRDTRNGTVAEIVPEGDTYSVNSFADYDFSLFDRDATAYYEFYYNHRETDAVGGYRQFFPFVPATNPTNPYGTNSPLAGFGGFAALAVLPSYDIQNPTNTVEIDRTNTFIGLRGDISANWTYDAYAGYSWSDGTYAQSNWLQGQVDASLDSELVGGNLVCSAASLALYPDCIAGNLFTQDALLNGVLPADYLGFISKLTEGSTKYTSAQFSGYVTGPLFELPAGEVSAVLGYEVRREEIDDVPDIEAQNDNLWGRTSSGITAGSDVVREFFTELEVPILADLPGAEELTFNGSWRYTDYNSYGDDNTYRVSLNWQVIPSLRLRATQGTSFRAPDLFEQFLDSQTGFQPALGNDPCIDYGTNYDPATNVYQNCAAQGLAPDFGTGGAPSIRAVTGGNPDLVAETSDAFTYGIVVQPEWIGLSLAVSWFDIELENTVASPSVGFVLGDCYTSSNFSSPFCQRVAPRDSMGFLTDVNASLLNVGLQKSQGYDIDVVYEHEFASFDFRMDLSATYTDEQSQDVLGVVNDFEGKWGFPYWASDVDFRADYRDWTFFYRIRWIGATEELPVDNHICETDPQTYHTVSARYTGATWEVIGTVGNLTNKKPPIVSDGCGSQSASRVFNTIPGAGYELLGRNFVVQISKGFDF
ncbi:MAG TPA: TonB-dependent receptor [Woeseiaceae bacterium]|nr:TonB-dependent receptor [Woeseiaceae bacterium]